MSRGRLAGVVLAGVLILHVGVLAAQVRPIVVAGPWGMWGDHLVLAPAPLVEVALRADRGGRWGYVPGALAGFPQGATCSDSHAMLVLVDALSRAAGFDAAYAAWALLAPALAPILVVLAARAAGASTVGAAGAGVIAVALIHLDALLRHSWRYGMIAWLLAAAVAALFTATFALLLHAPSRRRLLTVLAVLPLISVHSLCPPLMIVCWTSAVAARAFGARDGRRAALGWAALVAVTAVLVNAWWVVPLLRHYAAFSGDSEWHAIALTVSPLQALRDLASVVVPATGYLGGSYAPRFAVVVLGLAGAARRDAAPGARALGVLALATLALAYLGALVPVTAALEPHRFMLVAVLAAAAAAPSALEILRRPTTRAGRVALGAAGLAVVVSIACEAWRAVTLPLRPSPIAPADRALLERLAREPVDRGRLLVEIMPRARQTASAASLILTEHAHMSRYGFEAQQGVYGRLAWNGIVSTFLGRRAGDVRPADVPALLERYAVSVVVARSSWGVDLLEAAPTGTFSGREDVGPWHLYTVARPAGWFVSGAGAVDARPGRLRLLGLTGPVVVRFNHVVGLRALEGDDVVVEGAPVPGGPADFIRVDPRGRGEVTLVWDG